MRHLRLRPGLHDRPHGRQRQRDGEPRSGDPESESFLFTGEQYDARARDVHLIDADPGLYYLRARYYDPDIGRFLTQDPVPAVNLYAYVGNNPVNYVDPSGLCIPEINCPPGLGGGTQPPSLPKSKEGSNFVCTGEAQVFFLAQGAGEPHVQGDVSALVQVIISSGNALVLVRVSQVDERFGSNITIEQNFGGDQVIGPLYRSTGSYVNREGIVAIDENVLDYEVKRGQLPVRASVVLSPRLEHIGPPAPFWTPKSFDVDIACSRGR